MSEIEKTLSRLGLEEQEVKTYIALLELKEATATKLAERTSLGRVHMYQITTRLIEKGLVSYIIKNNVRYFLAADPETLLKDLQQKERDLQKILPQLKVMQQLIAPETKVETYRGREGINTILKMILRDRKPYFIQGGAQEACAIFELENTIFVKQAQKLKLQGKILARKKDKFFIGNNEKYKFIPDNLISSTTMILWNNKTAIFVWSKPYYAILIENQEITKSNVETFNYLWNTAQQPTKDDMKKRIVK